MSTLKEIDFLLIGKTGNGKSATGNSILMHKVFKSLGTMSSVTKKIKQGFGKHKGRVIRVVDSPGVGETRMDNAKAVLKVSKALRKAILMNPKGYHAFLILIKYGNRFTGEEQDAIKFLKDTFGANFVRDFCILVMCGGDNFKRDCEENADMTFEKWVNEQEGQIKNLIEECNGRILLFDNVTKEEQEKKEHLDKLIEIVDNLSAKGERYTDKHFEEAKETRDKILTEAKENIISDDILIKTNLIFQKLEKIRNGHYKKPAREKLEKLKKRCQEIIKDIKSGDNTSTIMNGLVESVTSLNRIIDLELQFNEKIDKERIENTKYREILKRRHEEEIEQIYTEFSRKLAEENKGDKSKKDKEIKQLFKKEIEELKTKIEHGCSRESVKTMIEQMEFNKKINDVQRQTLAKEERVEINKTGCSSGTKMGPKVLHANSGESVRDKIKRMELNKPTSNAQKQALFNEKTVQLNEQGSPDRGINVSNSQPESSIGLVKGNFERKEVNEAINVVLKHTLDTKKTLNTQEQIVHKQEEVAPKIDALPKESTSRTMQNKESFFRSHLVDILSRQVQEELEQKISEKNLQKRDKDERQKLIVETEQVEVKYRAVEDENNGNIFSRFIKWIKSLF